MAFRPQPTGPVSFGASGSDNMSAGQIREVLNRARLEAIRRSGASLTTVAPNGGVRIPGLRVQDVAETMRKLGGLPEPSMSLELPAAYEARLAEQNRRIDEELEEQRRALIGIANGAPQLMPRNPVPTPVETPVAKQSPVSLTPPVSFAPVKRRIVLAE